MIVVCEISLIKFLRYRAIRVGRASRNYYDVWLPDLAPSKELLKLGQAVDEEKRWRTFARKYRAEMNCSQFDSDNDFFVRRPGSLRHQIRDDII